MKLATFVYRDRNRDSFRLGAVLSEGTLIDLYPAAALYLKEVQQEKKPYPAASHFSPVDMIAFLRLGEEGLDLARRTVDYILPLAEKGNKPLQGIKKERLTIPMSEVVLKPPVPLPGKIIAMGLNYRDHAIEVRLQIPEFPLGFLKAPTSLIGAGEPVPYPKSTKKLDYEIELAIVIGKKGKDIPRAQAFEHIAGYSIFNDLSARDIQMREMKYRFLLMAKGLDATGPMGPYLVTKDEISDPQQLSMELYVNQEPEPRQKSNTNQMIFGIPELVEYWSQMTLLPGDIIVCGTTSGVAYGRQPDPEPWYLKPGDTVECRIQGLGILRNTII